MLCFRKQCFIKHCFIKHYKTLFYKALKVQLERSDSGDFGFGVPGLGGAPVATVVCLRAYIPALWPHAACSALRCTTDLPYRTLLIIRDLADVF